MRTPRGYPWNGNLEKQQAEGETKAGSHPLEFGRHSCDGPGLPGCLQDLLPEVPEDPWWSEDELNCGRAFEGFVQFFKY